MKDIHEIKEIRNTLNDLCIRMEQAEKSINSLLLVQTLFLNQQTLFLKQQTSLLNQKIKKIN
jgi:hypothetical protein